MAEGGRVYPNRPLVGVGALVVKDGRFLLVKRRNEPGKGLWGLPGGLVRAGERLVDAVKREVLEECGLEVRVGEFLAPLENLLLDAEGRVHYHYVLLDFLAYPEGGMLKAGTDAQEVRWFEPAVLDGSVEGVDVSPMTRSFLKEILDKVL